LIKFLSFYYHFCGKDSQIAKYYKKNQNLFYFIFDVIKRCIYYFVITATVARQHHVLM